MFAFSTWLKDNSEYKYIYYCISINIYITVLYKLTYLTHGLPEMSWNAPESMSDFKSPYHIGDCSVKVRF